MAENKRVKKYPGINKLHKPSPHKPQMSIRTEYGFVHTHMDEIYAIDVIKGVTSIDVKTEGVLTKRVIANFSLLFKDGSETLYEFISESSAIKAKEYLSNQLLGEN